MSADTPAAGPTAPPAPQPGRPAAWRSSCGVLLVALAALAVYANALPNPFHLDDLSIIVNNPRVRSFQTTELLTGNYWYLGDTDPLWRPLTLLSYAVNWRICREPWGFRLPNLLLHGAAAVLVYALLRRLYASAPAGLAGGLCFAVLPVHSEALNTIVGRADLLVTVLMLSALLCHWRDTEPGTRRRAAVPLLAAALYAAALLSKENAITLVGLVALLDAWRVGHGQAGELRPCLARRAARTYLPLLAITAVYLILRMHFLGGLTSGPTSIDWFDNPIAHPAEVAGPQGSPVLVRWGTPLATLARAARVLLIGDRLCFDYSYAALEPVRRWGDPGLWAGVGVLLLLGVLLVASLRRGRRVALALAFLAVTYSIVSNIPVVIGTIFAERLLYLPSVGFCMIVGLVADHACRRPPAPSGTARPAGIGRPLLCAGLIAVGLWYATTTVTRNRDWRSNESLYASAYRVNPRSCKVLAGRAANALAARQYAQGLAYCDQANRIAPSYWPAWRTGAVCLERMAAAEPGEPGRRQLTAQALARYQQAIDLGAAADPPAMMGAARLYAGSGNYRAAIRILEQLVRHRPLEAAAFDLLGRCLLTAEPPELRDPQRALDAARQAIRLRPEIANYVDTLADALLALGRRAEAIDAIEEVLETLPPDSPGVAHFRGKLEQINRSR